MKTIHLKTNGLGCANCALKIEKKLNQCDFVENAVLNFAASKLTVSLKPQCPDDIIPQIQKIVDSIEEGVVITEYGIKHTENQEQEHNHEHSHQESGNPKLPYALLAGSIILFIAGLFTDIFPANFIIFAASVLLCGYSLFIQGIKSLFKLRFDETTLITIAAVAAFAIQEYPEAALVVILFKIGSYLEEYAVSRSRKSISELLEIRPDTVNLVDKDGTVKEADAKLISIGQIVLIKPGERVPLDCIVLSGSSAVDNSALTGESLPLSVSADDALLSGGINLSGTIICQVTALFEDSAASKIIALVQDAAAKKANTETFISRFAAIYTPIVISLAVLIAVVPALFFNQDFAKWLQTSLVFLVSSCPCALVISVPLAFFSAIGAASKKGILIKGSKFVETLAKTEAVVFDKTGTLTSGTLAVKEVISINNGYSKEYLLQLAASAEQFSTHPVAVSITQTTEKANLLSVTDMTETAGKGVICTINNQQILCGSFKLMQDYNIDRKDYTNASLFLAAEGELIGCIFLSDQIREDAKDTMSALKSLGIKKTYMLTGDNVLAAEQIAADCGVDEYFANLLPQDKVSHLEHIKNQNGYTVFVGDGINDAPVLALADVGIAMGFGSDAAIESADMVLMSGKPSSIVDAIYISKRSVSIIKFNIVFALAIKGLVLLLAIFGLASIWMAVFADVGVSVISVLNASRILKIRRAMRQ